MFRGILCYFAFRRSLGHVRHLKALGWSLSVDDRTDTDPIPDLALDLLGETLESTPRHSFRRIFEFFHTQGITDFDRHDASELVTLFLTFLRRQLRQEISRRKKQADPQVENLKRRIRELTAKPPFYSLDGSGLITLASQGDDYADDLPSISDDDLLFVVNEAYLETTSRSGWCHAIFARLVERTDCCRAITRHRLTTAMIRVNAAHADLEGTSVSRLSEPAAAAIGKCIKHAVDGTLQRVRGGVLTEFESKGRLTANVADKLADACRAYLSDYVAHGGDTDSIPSYFREAMPGVTADQYQADYKHVFDTTTAAARKILGEILKNNPTVIAFGFYLRGE